MRYGSASFGFFGILRLRAGSCSNRVATFHWLLGSGCGCQSIREVVIDAAAQQRRYGSADVSTLRHGQSVEPRADVARYDPGVCGRP